MCATESLAFGATVNPWDPARTSGGSSGGSGTAVAAGLAAAALGTDGAGSIRIPAAACGLFGLKPQRDRLPMREGWNGLSVTGCLTRGVRDTALFGDAAAGTDWAAAARAGAGAAADRALAEGPARRDRARGGRAAGGGAGARRAAARPRPRGRRARSRLRQRGRPRVLARYLHGVRTEADAMAHPERLSRKTRGLASLGRRAARRAGAARARRGGGRPRARRTRSSSTPTWSSMPALTRRPPLVGEWDDLPAPVMLNGMVNFTAFLGFWNHTGQPAASVPSRGGGGRLPGRRPARRPPRRRGDAALARRAARGGLRLGGAAAAAGGMSERGAARRSRSASPHEAGAGLRERVRRARSRSRPRARRPIS